MEENYFTDRCQYHKQLKGSPMANSLCPFISEIFIASLEMKLASAGLMITFWKRHLEDICLIIEKSKVENTLDFLKRLHTNIEFPLEMEVIPSHGAYQRKVASFNHTIYRMLTLHISSEGVVTETEQIVKVARLNVYTNLTISSMISKRKRMFRRKRSLR